MTRKKCPPVTSPTMDTVVMWSTQGNTCLTWSAHKAPYMHYTHTIPKMQGTMTLSKAFSVMRS